MSEQSRQALHEAEFGDLRPQVNPKAPAALADLSGDLKVIEPVLTDRLFQLSRPIADASTRPGGDIRLQDAGRFFYLIETLSRLHYEHLEDMLLIVLDEFAQLTEQSYDELYLWCLIQLSRTDSRYVKQFWPQAIALDLRFRPTFWKRPAGTRVYEQPYRFTDLLFYYYVIYTLHKTSQTGSSLLACLRQTADAWSSGERALVAASLSELAEEEPHRPAYSDALHFLRLERGGRTPTRTRRNL